MKKEEGVLKQLEEKNLNKSKLPIAIVCIVLAVVILFGGLWALFAFAFPSKLADFAYNINLNSYALKLYERDYNKNKDINSLYMALNIEIKRENSEGIVEKYEEFKGLSYYNDFVKNVDAENLKIDEKPIVKASLLNEDNYLKNRYIKALVKLDKGEKAFEFAKNDLLNLNPTFDNLGNYLFGAFCGDATQYVDDFNAGVGAYEGDPLILTIEGYLDKLDTLFDGYLTFDKTYSYAIGNRIMEVGGDLLNLYKVELIGGAKDSEHVQNIMGKVTKNFKILAME